MSGVIGRGERDRSGIIGHDGYKSVGGFSNLSRVSLPADGFYNILTPNGGWVKTYCIQDKHGIYMVVGKLAADACLTVAGTISTNRDTVQDSSGTAMSCNFGDYPCKEVRYIGTNSIEGDWESSRNIDFIHGIDGKPWKNVWAQSAIEQTYHPNTPLSGVKYGYWCTYCKDGRHRWSNYEYHSHGMSDGANVSVAPTDFTEPGSFSLNAADDAKFTVHYNREGSGQDGPVSAGFGQDDSIIGFFDLNKADSSNMGGGRTYSTAVYVCIR
jgi:hypothetical protein